MITLNVPIQCAWRRPMATETRAHAKCRSPSTLRASAHTDVEWAKFKFVMYSVLRDPAVCVLPGGDYRKLVDGSAFATDINHDRQPYNVFVVDDDTQGKTTESVGFFVLEIWSSMQAIVLVHCQYIMSQWFGQWMGETMSKIANATLQIAIKINQSLNVLCLDQYS